MDSSTFLSGTHEVRRFGEGTSNLREFVRITPEGYGYPDSRWAVYFIEAVKPSSSPGDVKIKVEIELPQLMCRDPEWTDETRPRLTVCDEVRLTAVEVKYFHERALPSGWVDRVEVNNPSLVGPHEVVNGVAKFGPTAPRARVAVRDVRASVSAFNLTNDQRDSSPIVNLNVPVTMEPDGWFWSSPLRSHPLRIA